MTVHIPSAQDLAKRACSPLTTPDFRLGDAFIVRPSLYRVTKDGVNLRVGPKMMHVLVCLANSPGQVVHRDVLMDTVWPDADVVEEVLTRSVSELRKLFNDDPKEPRIIETIRNVGYRLLVRVSFDTSEIAHLGAGARDGRATNATANGFNRHPVSGMPWSLVIGVTIALIVVVGLLGLNLWTPEPVPLAGPLEAVPLTSYPGEERGGVLSSDGQSIAFSWSGDTGGNVDIHVKDMAHEKLRRLTDDPALDVSPAWSPSGDRVAFIRRDRDEGCTLLVVPVRGGPESVVGSCGQNRSPDLAWSPDGQWLAYSDRESPTSPSLIVLSALASAEKRVVTSPPALSYGDIEPSFSPDGENLAFTRRFSAEAYDLYLIGLDSGSEARLTHDGRLIRGHTWMPDGQSVVFASNRGVNSGLWRIPLHGGTPVWIAIAGTENALHPNMASGSNRLVFEYVVNEINIWHVDLDPTDRSERQPRPFLVSTRTDVMPHYSPDGSRVVFVSSRSGFHELWVANDDGSNPAKLTSMDGAMNGDPRWSPDSKEIAFSSLHDQHGDVFVVEVESGRIRQLTASDSDDWVPRWSRDGHWIYFASNRDGSWQIWKVGAGGGDGVQVTHRGGRAVSESLDGRFLYVARSDTGGIWRMPVEGGAPTLVVSRTAPYDWGNWTVVDDGIYFVDRRDPGAGISFFHFDTGETTTEASLASAVVRSITRGMPSLTVSTDRRRVAFARFDRRERDIEMVELRGPASTASE